VYSTGAEVNMSRSFFLLFIHSSSFRFVIPAVVGVTLRASETGRGRARMAEELQDLVGQIFAR